jgi:hypothetical protein
MAGQNAPKDGFSWMRESERRTRILERHNHPPITADVQTLFLLRAQNLLVGGGTRTVISTGVNWSSAFRVMGAGQHPLAAPTGILAIQNPVNGTVIPVHGDSSVTDRTVGSGTTSGYVPLVGNESLWYDLQVVGSANEGSTGTDSLGFHIISDVDTPVVIPSTWVRIITRQDVSGSSPMYVWGDMVRQG